MVIDNLTDTSVYYEKMSKFNIICNSQVNNENVIEKDTNNNNLINIIDLGDSLLTRLLKYNGEDYILFYNKSDNNMRMVKQGDYINMYLDFVNGTKFYANAKKVYGKKNIDSNIFNLDSDISQYTIFKAFLDNGKELKNYVYSNGDTITVNGNDKLYLDEFSEIILYVYKTAQNYDIELEYQGYKTIFDMQDFITENYFSDIFFKGSSLNSFDSCEISQDMTQDSYKRPFRSVKKNIVNSNDNTMTLEVFNGSEYTDIVNFLHTDEFRFIFVNPSYGKITIVNNCKIDSGVSLIFQREKNTKKFTISCGNYIEITSSEQSKYGMGEYGEGKYGGELSIYNSFRG